MVQWYLKSISYDHHKLVFRLGHLAHRLPDKIILFPYSFYRHICAVTRHLSRSWESRNSLLKLLDTLCHKENKTIIMISHFISSIICVIFSRELKQKVWYYIKPWQFLKYKHIKNCCVLIIKVICYTKNEQVFIRNNILKRMYT